MRYVRRFGINLFLTPPFELAANSNFYSQLGAYRYMMVLRYRVAKTDRIPYLYRLFSAKVTYI